MSLFMSLDCPHCMVSQSPFSIQNIVIVQHTPTREGPVYEIDACGTCGPCGRVVMASFIGTSKASPAVNNARGDLTNEVYFQGHRANFKKVLQAPEPSQPEVPDHLPVRLMRPFLEAEKAFALGLWSSAAAGYRKTVDRAITPLIADQIKVGQRPMLGPKIGMLEKTDLLPPAMLDWIRIVKDDGNFALHDDDQDFDTREQVEPAREFAFTLLTYLYTLPEKVRIARGQPPEAGPATEADLA